MNIDYIKNWLKENLTEKRYLHSIGVAEMSVNLAERFGIDKEKAYVAGLLHDCAKCEGNKKLLSIIKNELSDMVLESEINNSKTLHAPVSAYYAKKIFNISDPEILSAIRWHTIGKLNMSYFEMIIFLADKIERKTRDKIVREKIYSIFEKYEGKLGLRMAILECFNRTIISLVRRQLEICYLTIEVYNDLLAYKNACLL